MKFYEIFSAYNAIGQASFASLDTSDIQVLLDFREQARLHINAFQEAQKDAAERLKPDVEGKPKEEADKLNAEYQKKLAEVLNVNFTKDIDFTLGEKRASKQAKAVILQQSKLTVNDVEFFGFLFEKV